MFYQFCGHTLMLIQSSKALHVSACVVPGYKCLPHRVQWYRFYSIVFFLALWVVPWYDLPSTQCLSIQIFSSMTHHVACGYQCFGTQGTVIWIFHSMNLHVALSVICGISICIQNFNLIAMNNMSYRWIFHVAFYVNFSNFSYPSCIFFLKHEWNNQNGNVWSPY